MITSLTSTIWFLKVTFMAIFNGRDENNIDGTLGGRKIQSRGAPMILMLKGYVLY